jgi:hypothetical protein
MYPRNAASPEPIAIGAVVQISDGAVQTSGCTVRIKPIGVAEGDGGGTTAYSTDGIVLYTPTQAETNYTSFILIAKKTGCIPACVTVVTTASSVPGRTVPADGSITAAVIATDAIDADAIKADAVTEIQAGLATATNVSDAQAAIITQVDANETKIDAVKAKTDNLPSDPADQSAVEAAITAATSPLATAANLATVAGYLDTEIAAILADTNELQLDWADGGRLDLILDARSSQTSVDDLPTNAELATALGTADDAVLAAIATVQADTDNIQTRLPAALESGRIAAALDSAATAALVDLIWDEPLTGATHNVATSSGKRLRQSTAFQQIDSTVIDASATATTFVTGLDSVVDDFYNDSMLVFTDGALAGQVRSIVDYVGATKTIVLEEPLTSAPVNGVAFTIVSLHIHPVSQIQSGLATSAALAAVKTILDKVDTGLVVDGAVWQFTANMLELGPSGGGGSGDATLAKQEEILTQLDVIQTKTDTIGSVGAITSLLAAAVLEPGTITSFPETLTIGDSYTEQNGREIQIPIVDTDGTPLSSTGSLNFADASVTFTLQRSGETDSTRVITGTATFVDPPGTGTGAGAPYAVIELPASETAKGLKKYKYSGILTFLWTYAGTGTADDVMSFETGTVTFDS